MRKGLVVVAAGASRRMNNVDKVWSPLGDAPMVVHSIRRLCPCVDVAVLVTREDALERARIVFSPDYPALKIVPGGAKRIDSVALGLVALGAVDAVAIHDAARPFAPAEMLQTGFGLLNDHDGAIPVEPLHDTIKEIDGTGRVRGTLDRSVLFAAQTPQVFQFASLQLAHCRAEEHSARATDDAFLMERAGYDVHTFPGSATNFKVTTAQDLHLARLLLAEGLAP